MSLDRTSKPLICNNVRGYEWDEGDAFRTDSRQVAGEFVGDFKGLPNETMRPGVWL